MTRVLCASSAAGVAFLAAAIDDGRIGDGRIVLLVANEASTPEIVPDPREAPGFDDLAARADDVVSWNDLVAPLHPSAWRPPQREIPVLARLLAARLAPQHDVIDELVVESVTEGPGRTLCALLPDVPITLAAHTLVAYAPPLVDASSEVGGRVTRLLHLDLVPDVRPMLTFHAGTVIEPVPVASFRSAVAALSGGRPAEDIDADAVVLGGRYAERGLLGVDDELGLWLDTVRALTAGGFEKILFAPDPAAGPVDHTPLIEAAESAGARLTVGPAGMPHEAWTAATSALVVGTTSPALFVADRRATSGCRRLLDLLRYDHPDRMPLTIADALLPKLGADGRVTTDAVDLALLVDSVAFCLVPDAVPELRDRAAEGASRNGIAPYLRPSRLTSLDILDDTRAHAATTRTARPRGRTRRLAARARTWLGSHSFSGQS